MKVYGFQAKRKTNIDYVDTYAIVETISSTRLWIALTAIYNLVIC